MSQNNKIKNFAFAKRNHSLLAKEREKKEKKITQEENRAGHKIKKRSKKMGRPEKPESEKMRQVGIGLKNKEIEKLEQERVASGFPNLVSYIRNLLIKKNII